MSLGRCLAWPWRLFKLSRAWCTSVTLGQLQQICDALVERRDRFRDLARSDTAHQMINSCCLSELPQEIAPRCHLADDWMEGIMGALKIRRDRTSAVMQVYLDNAVGTDRPMSLWCWCSIGPVGTVPTISRCRPASCFCRCRRACPSSIPSIACSLSQGTLRLTSAAR